MAVISCAGFEDLAAAGPATDRAIVNNTVALLAGYFGDLGTHPKGATDCPLYFNEERNFGLMAGRQRFDPACRVKLQSALADETDALDALLNLFP